VRRIFSYFALSTSLLVLVSCGYDYAIPEISRLADGDFLVQHEGRVWQVAPGDLDRAAANLRTRGTPFDEKRDEWSHFEACVDAGGSWRFDHGYCYWSLRSADRRVRP
jgi:hypothetical protein